MWAALNLLTAIFFIFFTFYLNWSILLSIDDVGFNLILLTNLDLFVQESFVVPKSAKMKVKLLNEWFSAKCSKSAANDKKCCKYYNYCIFCRNLLIFLQNLHTEIFKQFLLATDKKNLNMLHMQQICSILAYLQQIIQLGYF